MTAPVSKVPNGPGFEIVKVPAASSSGPRRFVLALSATSRTACASWSKSRSSALRITGTTKTLVVDVDRNPEIYVEMNDEFIVTNRRVESRKVAKRFDGRNRVEGQVTQTEALSLFECAAQSGSNELHLLVVHLLHHQRVGRRGL